MLLLDCKNITDLDINDYHSDEYLQFLIVRYHSIDNKS